MTRIPLARHRQRRELVPGEVIRFRNRRRFFTSTSMALTPLAAIISMFVFMFVFEMGRWGGGVGAATIILGWGVFVFTVPPKDGRRFYEVTAAELVIHTAEERRVIPWYEVRLLFHRPDAGTRGRDELGDYTTTYHEYLELFTPSGPVLIHGVHRQTILTKLVIDQCRGRFGDALLARFDRDGEVTYGDFRLTRDGVHGSVGFLSWRTDWQIRRSSHPDGIQLTVTAPDKREATGWVPVEMIALDLLTTLAARQSR